ncbi:unnamed protein product [Caenorhabditis bovis]|uniref:guanylate cyclase n=1 Tax=Caenorhabditis bovis TaxID=2654633 RepID=A0A8S1EJB7_9PELO|nr:unnamed protein product [Caenorhabditis bovis]
MIEPLLFLWLFFICYVECIPLTVFSGWNPAAGICQAALNEANANGQCDLENIELLSKESCTDSGPIRTYLIEMIGIKNQSKDIGIVGPSCTFPAYTFVAYSKIIWHVPVVTTVDIDHTMLKPDARTIVNVGMFSAAGAAKAIKTLMDELKEDNISLIGGKSKGIAYILKNYIKQTQIITIRESVELDNENVDALAEMDKIKASGSRMIVVCSDFEDFYDGIYKLDMDDLVKRNFIVVILANEHPETFIVENNLINALAFFQVFIRVNKINSPFWTKERPPIDTECLLSTDCDSILVQVIIGVFVLLCGVSGCFIYYYYQRRRTQLYLMSWKIPRENLKVIVNKNANAKMQKELENKKNQTEAERVASKEAMLAKRRVFGSYGVMGSTRAELMKFKQNKNVSFNKKQTADLLELQYLQHENMSKFLGIACNEPDNQLLCAYTLIERATLEEICLDHDYTLDHMFKSAFFGDLVRGLSYLHKSKIGYHGFLNTSNCMVDVNWVLKLSNFGISNIMADLLDKNIIKGETVPPLVSYSQYIWFAPEHMKEYDESGKKPPRLLRGSMEGDMYSFGLVIWQMIFRTDPFLSGSPVERPTQSLVKDIIHNDLKPDLTPNGEENALIRKIEECLSRDINQRPSLRGIQEAVYKCYPSASGNLIDQMLHLNMKNAAILERIVKERQAMVEEAKGQTMRLLNEMLPASIAKILTNGGQVPPRSYDSATVMFVQICDFPVLMHQSNPDQIVFFLNDVFDTFDTIIKGFDAYKVETTGETYMVASGVPTENDGAHIYEIAEISLMIRESALKYTVKHLKNFKLRLKIGFHAGPIAAGVIGIRSPRYCLFGDTVNFASRMQSNCPPNQIQTSEQTARLLFDRAEYQLVKRGIVHVKGKGEVNCYWLNEHLHHEDDLTPNVVRPITKSGKQETMPESQKRV